MIPLEVARVYAQPSGELATQMVVVDGAGMYAHMAVWAIVIVGIVELIKRLWLAKTLEKRLRYRRIVALLPLAVGTLSAPVFGPPALEPLSLQFSPVEAIWLGPAAGAAAGWAFSLFKHTIAPLAPSVLLESVRVFLGRFGVEVRRSDDDE